MSLATVNFRPLRGPMTKLFLRCEYPRAGYRLPKRQKATALRDASRGIRTRLIPPGLGVRLPSAALRRSARPAFSVVMRPLHRSVMSLRQKMPSLYLVIAVLCLCVSIRLEAKDLTHEEMAARARRVFWDAHSHHTNQLD